MDEESCRKRRQRAYSALAQTYYSGDDGVDISYQEAKRWCDLGVAGNDANALWLLGNMFDSGDGVQQDRAEALELFRLSAKQGCPPGLKAYGGALYQDGAYKKALGYFETCAMMEKHVAYRPIVAFCHLFTVVCLAHINNENEKTGSTSAAEDPLILILFGLVGQSRMEMKTPNPSFWISSPRLIHNVATA